MKEKVVAYTPLLYGKEYLRWAVEAVEPFVSKHVILYTDQPSYCYECNRVPGAVCPDTEEELRACLDPFDHIQWVSGRWNNEIEHRMDIFKHIDMDQVEYILPVDADEVWDPMTLLSCLTKIATEAPRRRWRVAGFQHLWRSFVHRCTDVLAPTRIIDLRTREGEATILGKVFHFGYAVSEATMRYKWSVHGHQNELRPNWLEEKYLGWKYGDIDVHPTNENNWWEPKMVPPDDFPMLMLNHPYWGVVPIP